MVKIDYRLYQNIELAKYHPQFILESVSTIFLGEQQVIINDYDFTSQNVPILWFAWHLRQLMQWVEIGTRPYEIKVSNGSTILFTRAGDQIQVISHSFSGQANTTLTEPTELGDALFPYCKNTFKSFCSICPPMGSDEQIRDWWYRPYLSKFPCRVIKPLGELPRSGYEVQITDTNKLAILHCSTVLFSGDTIIAEFGSADNGTVMLWYVDRRET